jgi:hypothetical protein
MISESEGPTILSSLVILYNYNKCFHWLLIHFIWSVIFLFFFSVYAKLSMHVGGCVGDSWSHQSMPTTYFSHIRFEIEINLK